jgi:type I restriction enzyme S subunit
LFATLKKLGRGQCYATPSNRFRVVKELVDPEYLEIALNSPSVVREIDARKSGISESGISLNHGRVRSLNIPMPFDLSVQRRIVQSTRERLSIVEYTEQLVNEQTEREVILRQAILHKAFEGTLLPQDDEDEPASLLLERIRAERQNSITRRRKNMRNGRREAA